MFPTSHYYYDHEYPQVLNITGGSAASETKTATVSSRVAIPDATPQTISDIVIELRPYQASASPTPSNPYTLQGYSGITLYRKATAYASLQNSFAVDWSATAGTIMGGTYNASTGVLTVTWVEIASYNGETLPGEWMSSMDVYAPGTTPTIGAQVAYKIAEDATPTTYNVGTTSIQLYAHMTNYIWAKPMGFTTEVDVGHLTVTYTPYEISITEEDVLINGFNIDRYCCTGNKIEVGTAISAEMTLKLNNADGKFSSVNFEGLELFVNIGTSMTAIDGSQKYEYMPVGYFICEEQPRTQTVISIKALDRMIKFDAEQPTLVHWIDHNNNRLTDENGNYLMLAAELVFPTTVSGLVKQICALRDVFLGYDLTNANPADGYMTGRPNTDLVITALPNISQPITYRNLIQWCAGLMGTCAYIDWNGHLCFNWFDRTLGNNYVSYTSTEALRFASDLAENDITISGIQYTNAQGGTLVSGSADYTIDLSGNWLVGGNANTALPALNTQLNGFTYRPMTATVVTAPYLWPLDKITFTDKDGNNHTCVVTNVNFGLNTPTKIAAKGETSTTNSAATPSPMTTGQGVLVEQVTEKTTQLDEALNQEGIFNRLTNNGQEQGIILYDGKIYVNASYIQTGVLNADLIKAGVIRGQTGDSYWNLLSGAMNLIGKFSAELTSSTGTYRMELADGGLELYLDGVKIAEMKWRDMFLGQGITLRGEQIVMDALTQDAQGNDDGGASVTAKRTGELFLTCDGLMIGEAGGVHTIGVTDTITFDDYDGVSHGITVVKGIITNIY